MTSASTWTRSGPGSRSSSARARWTRSQQPPAAAARGLLRRRRRPARKDCGGHIPFSRSAKKALELALRESVGLGSREILVEHLVLGLMRAEGLATTLVTRLGVAPTDVRRKVLDGLGRAA